jgi:methylase of polypeptide subunit release factors
MPLRDVLGALGSAEWNRRGMEIPGLGRLHPCYGVFAPVRAEYVGLVAGAPAPEGLTAFDLGTGTGVLALLLARRGATRVIATDIDARAVACARANATRLGLEARVEVREHALFPDGHADLIVCNPPWLPLPAQTALDRAVYDADSQMLRGFLAGLDAHLAAGGEGWLVLSDLAERLGLRAGDALPRWIADAGLEVRWRKDARPTHRRSQDESEALFEARSQEVVTLWALGRRGESPKRPAPVSRPRFLVAKRRPRS